MSWHDPCIDYHYGEEVFMKPNRYGFCNKDGTWNFLKFGGNYNDKFWIVSDEGLSYDQLQIVIEKMCIRPHADVIANTKHSVRLGKSVLWFELKW